MKLIRETLVIPIRTIQDKTDSDKADNTDKPSDKGSKDEKTSNEDGSGTTLPKTGDEDNALLVIALVAAAGALVFFALSRPRKAYCDAKLEKEQDGAFARPQQGFLPCQERCASRTRASKPPLRSFLSTRLEALERLQAEVIN